MVAVPVADQDKIGRRLIGSDTGGRIVRQKGID
jgi:hypothetical protein